MGKDRKTRKQGGVVLTILVLPCILLTGCDLLDIRDGGLGMTNPDYVESEEVTTTSDHTESMDLGESQKEGTASWLTEAGWKMSIESCSWNDDFTETSLGELLWESDDGLPLILRCNLSDLFPNVQVTARKGSREVSWYPYYLTFAGEIKPADGVKQLLSGSYMPEEGYLYGMEGEAFFPFTSGSVEKFYLHPVAAAGENYDYSGNEIDVLLAQSEVQERLELGMAIRDVDGMETIQGEACVLFALGTEHPDQFVAEYYYAVSPSGLVYRMDDLTGEWEPI